MKKTNEEWYELGAKLHLRELPTDEIPRLLHECLMDRRSWELAARNALKFIEELKIRIEKELEEV